MVLASKVMKKKIMTTVKKLESLFLANHISILGNTDIISTALKDEGINLPI